MGRGFGFGVLRLWVPGRKDRALEHIRIAAADRFERHGGYMHMVARVHARKS
jgi:hypothetical protein